MGTFKNSAFRAASIYDPATGDRAQMNTLLEGTKLFEPEIIEQPITNGAYQSGWRNRVEFHSSDWDAYEQLRTFKDEYTKVRSVAAGAGTGSKNLQWYESVYIAELRKVPKGLRNEGDSYFVVTLIHEGGENAAIFNNVNLLHQINVSGVTVKGFVDGDADGVADGWSSSSLGVKTFASGEQVINISTDLTFIDRNIHFPIGSCKIVLSAERTELHPYGGNQLYLSASYFNSEEIISSIKSITTVGRKYSDLTTTSNTYNVLSRICRAVNVTAAGEVREKLPCLRTDGQTDYIAG